VVAGAQIARDGRPGPTATRRPPPPFTPAHEELRGRIRGWVERELLPRAEAWEAAGFFDGAVFPALAAEGLLGLSLPREYGGGGDPVADAVFVEELARCGSGGVAAGIGAHCGIALPPIWRFGTEAQRRCYLEPGIRGELVAALAITEPDAGSDVAALRTQARRVDGGYVVNGAKTFITGGVRAHVLVTAVRTGPPGHAGVSFLIIERGPGVHSTPLAKLGWHASDTALITFDDVFVPEENLLGEENRGFYLIMANFQWERLLMALGAVGAMQVCLERTLALLRARPRPPGQAVRHRLAAVATTLETGRAMTYAALRRHVSGAEAVREVTMAKLATQRAAVDAIATCLDVLDLEADAALERALRDARLGPIGGGTDEIMKEILGRSMGL
jgi:acyl-CoA dehydrogenase